MELHLTDGILRAGLQAEMADDRAAVAVVAAGPYAGPSEVYALLNGRVIVTAA
ncbi:hypothetical protein Ssi03_76720 [Sphaerisporangium siamense]|nr:hypothetical protein Ssi03_76720 [Sphaerisporangium siamense]